MIKLLAIAAGLVLTASAHAQTNGTISAPNIFGERTIRYNNGLNGTISNPDIFGERHFRYNNGTSGTISSPDIFGDQHIRTMPRRNQWGY